MQRGRCRRLWRNTDACDRRATREEKEDARAEFHLRPKPDLAFCVGTCGFGADRGERRPGLGAGANRRRSVKPTHAERGGRVRCLAITAIDRADDGNPLHTIRAYTEASASRGGCNARRCAGSIHGHALTLRAVRKWNGAQSVYRVLAPNRSSNARNDPPQSVSGETVDAQLGKFADAHVLLGRVTRVRR